MKRSVFWLVNGFGPGWFFIGILSAIGVLSSINVFIIRGDTTCVLLAIVFGLVGGFSFWLVFTRFFSWEKHSPDPEYSTTELSIGKDGFRYSDSTRSVTSNWDEITFMGIYQILHLGYSKKYFMVVVNGNEPMTIDCDAESFGFFAEQLCYHFPKVEWNWYYEFQLDKSFPRSRVIFGDGESVEAWQKALEKTG